MDLISVSLEVLDSKIVHKTLYYLVCWVHFGEGVKALDVRAPRPVREFHARYSHKPRPGRKVFGEAEYEMYVISVPLDYNLIWNSLV